MTDDITLKFNKLFTYQSLLLNNLSANTYYIKENIMLFNELK